MPHAVHPLSDGDLLRRFSTANDQQAFADLVERHAGLVFQVCHRILGHRQEAEDATQAVFLTLAHKATSLQNRATVSTWLYQVAWHVSVRARASMQARSEREKEVAAMNAQKSNTDDETHAAIRSILDAELSALPETLLQPLVLHHLQGCSEEEGARVLGVKLGTFSSRLHRAREALRERLAGRGYALPAGALALVLTNCAMSAELAPAFVTTTAKVALLCKSGNAAAANIVSSQTLQWTDGALKMLAAKKIKMAAASAALVALSLLVGGMFYHSAAAGTQPPARPAPVVETKQEQRDAKPQSPQRLLGVSAFQSPGSLQSVVMSQDDKYVAATGDKFVAVWEIATETLLARLNLDDYGYDLRFLKDNTLLILPDSFGSKPVTFLSWDWQNKQKPQPVGQPASIPGFHAPHDRFLSGRLMTLSRDESIAFAPGGSANGALLRAIDVRTGKVLPGIEGASRSMPNVEFHLSCIALSDDQSLLACVDTVCGWSGENVKTMQPRSSARFTVWDWKTKEKKFEWIKTANQVDGLRWMPGNTQLFVSSFDKGTAAIFDAADGREVRRFAGPGMMRADGSVVAICAKDRIHTFDPRDGKELSSFVVGEFKYPRQASMSASGRYLSYAIGDSFLLVDLNEKKRISPSEGAHLNKPYWMQYVADGRLILYDGTLSRIYDERGTPVQTFKSRMYSLSSNTVAHGDLLIAPGWDGGEAEVWDIRSVTLLGHLGKSTHALKGVQLSKDGNWVLIGYEYNGKAVFFDLKRGEMMSELQGPRHDFFGPVQSISGCVWTKDGNRAYVADTSASYFDTSDLTKLKLKRPLGLAGAYHPQTGMRDFFFKDAQGAEIEVVMEVDLSPAEDLLYVRRRGTKANVCSLHNPADGTFLREVADPGVGAKFSSDGTILAGTAGATDVQTGQSLHALPKGGTTYLSPSRTLIAQVLPGVIHIVDARSGLLVWQCDYEKVSAKPNVAKFSWHPAEHQIAFSQNENPSVLQIDLFENPNASSDLDLGSPDAIRRALTHTDAVQRQSAIRKIIDAGAASLPLLKKILETPAQTANDTLAARMTIFTLERIACDSASFNDVFDFLTEHGKQTESKSAVFARDALLRLSATRHARELQAKLKNPQPVKWPIKDGPRPGVKPPGPPQEF